MTSLFENLLKRANEIYWQRKAEKHDLSHCAPEMLPKISSDQALAIIEIMAQEIERLEQRIYEK